MYIIIIKIQHIYTEFMKLMWAKVYNIPAKYLAKNGVYSKRVMITRGHLDQFGLLMTKSWLVKGTVSRDILLPVFYHVSSSPTPPKIT
jgi:hypothetical protein